MNNSFIYLQTSRYIPKVYDRNHGNEVFYIIFLNECTCYTMARYSVYSKLSKLDLLLSRAMLHFS